MKHFIEDQSRQILNAHSEDKNEQFIQGLNFTDENEVNPEELFTNTANEKKKPGKNAVQPKKYTIRKHLDNEETIDHKDYIVKEDLQEEIDFLEENFANLQAKTKLNEIELPHPADEYFVYKKFMSTPKDFICKRYLLILDVLAGYSGLPLESVVQVIFFSINTNRDVIQLRNSSSKIIH